MNEKVKSAIALVQSNEDNFAKFITANDSGKTSHQAGIYFPKSAISMLFEEPLVRGANYDRMVNCGWQDGSEFKVKFLYYGRKKNEYRITNFNGRKLPQDHLFILSKRDFNNYHSVVLTPEEADYFLGYFDLDRKDTNKLIVFPKNKGETALLKTEVKKKGQLSLNLIPSEPPVSMSFKPRARLLLQLGDQLIKNENIALLELIKNSYDADASQVNVTLNNVDNQELGIILIEDNGFGMDRATVVDVWMEPGSDFKSQKFNSRQVTPEYGRLPIGEKGIGRFGVHKLGYNIEMISKKKGTNEVIVEIDWTLFESQRYLEDVPIIIKENKNPTHFKGGRTGTYLKISNLRKEWTRGMAREANRAILSLMSPFDSQDQFRVDYQVVDKPSWLDGLLSFDNVKDYSLYYFEAEIKDKGISNFKYEFTPWPSMSGLSDRSEDETNIVVKENLDLFVKENRKEIPFTLENEGIGTIKFKGYIFDQDAHIMKLGLQSDIDDRKGFKSYLKQNGGVRVYREGLRIYDYGEPENDWLGLDIRRVNSPVKKLSNNMLFGAVYLNRSESEGLVEKTNREGFVESSAYFKFKDSILHVLGIVETLRQPDKIRLRELYGPSNKSEPVLHTLSELKTFVDEKIKDTPVKQRINNYLSKIESDYKSINETLLKAAGAGLSLSVVVHEVEKIILEVEKVLKSEKASERAMKLITHLNDLVEGYSHIIRKSSAKNEDLKNVITQGVFSTSYRLRAHKVIIEQKYKDSTPTSIKISRSLVLGCLINIIDNSIYWLTRAGKSDGKIFIDLVNENDSVIILIADNGPGFNLPTDVIVKPFISGKIDGMGLGLHIVSEIMNALKGEVIFPDAGDYEIPSEYKNGAIIGLKFKM